MIDNLEPALENGKFIEPHRNYVELLRVLGEHDGKSITLITSREELAESAIKIETYPLEGLTEEAWQDYFNYHKINIDQPTLKAMRDAYGGNAKAMDILRGAVLQDYKKDKDMVAYWENYREDLLADPRLEYLVISQFNRLKMQDHDAYKLLLRLGCYRYQDVPTVRTEGLLCLLWDVKARKIRVIEHLKSRGLVEHKNGEYWLHPVIKQEATDRIKETEDWETANRQAAEFWTDSVEEVNTVDDALRAFEAYHHYFYIGDYDQAGCVIIHGRDNQWEKLEHLGRSFYRLGLLQPMIVAIKELENKLEQNLILGRLYNILGDLYWLIGKLRQAIDCHKKSGDIAFNYTDFDNIPEDQQRLVNRLIINHYFNIGLCKMDVLELEEAKLFFEKSTQILENTYFLQSMFYKKRIGLENTVFFIFLKSCLYSYSENVKLVDVDCVYETIPDCYLDSWGKGYVPLFIAMTYKNLGNIEKSHKVYEQAMFYSEQSNYKQVKAKALTGIGELYRIKKYYDQAIENHEESIKILEEIGAKCDLAEAYYQIALTYQEMGKIDKSKDYFDKAIELFTQIDAPKQIERVQNSIQTP